MPPLQASCSAPVEAAAETLPAPSALSLASGNERPVRSPALELQEALQEMLAMEAVPAPKPAAALTLGVGLIGIAGVCAAFWVGVGRVLIALI
jgi:hypothetical protein